jgi:hypothetical protein
MNDRSAQRVILLNNRKRRTRHRLDGRHPNAGADRPHQCGLARAQVAFKRNDDGAWQHRAKGAPPGLERLPIRRAYVVLLMLE